MLVDLLLNLAAGLTQTLFEDGAQELAKTLADPQRDALKACYTRAFEAALADVARAMRAQTGEVSEADLELVRDVLQEMFQHQPAYRQMLRLAAERNGLDLFYWEGRYRAVNGPNRLRHVPFDLKRTLTTLHSTLTKALDEAAEEAESPLHNWWTVNAVRSLQDEQRSQSDLLRENLALTGGIAERHGLEAYLRDAVRTLEASSQRSLRPTVPTQPYKFLDAFELKDHAIFFGRDAASQALFEKVMAKRLTILHAKSGAGKSSLLQAGLGPRLVQAGQLPVYARAYGDPIEAIKRAVAARSHGEWPASLSTLTLHEFLGMICQQLNGMDELVVMLDQFEAFFVLGPTGEHQRPFIDALADCIEDASLRVRFVIALRKDYYADLSAFQPRLPQIFHHEMALDSMTRAEAEAAITGPVAKLGRPVTYEPTLLDTLLADLTRGEVELPHLQIICYQLYEGLVPGETTISQAAYEALDRATGVLGGYLRRVLGQFKEDERKLAKAVLVALVSSEGTKRVLRYEALAEQVKAEHATVESVLARLVDGRLVQRDEVEGAPIYEIAHEYLVPEIQKWFDQETLAAKQANELLEREVSNWRVHGTLIPEERLALLHQHRTFLSVHSEDAVHCLVHSAVQAGHQLEDWIELAGETAENPLFTLLKEQDKRVKRKAVEGLGVLWKFNEVKQLNSATASVRQEAARRLGRLGDVRAVEPLIAYLDDVDPSVRQETAVALGKLEDPRAIEPLTARLSDVNAGVRRETAVALGKLGDEQAVKPLITCLNDKNANVRRAAAEALSNIKSVHARVDLLIAHLNDTDTTTRREAAEALGKLGDAQSVDSLIAHLNDADDGVRQAVAVALGRLADTSLAPLIACLDDADAGVRYQAAEVLGRLGDVRAVEPLIACLDDADAGVRYQAAEVLGRLGDVRAVEPLIACLDDADAGVRQRAAVALGNLAGFRNKLNDFWEILGEKDRWIVKQELDSYLRVVQAIEPLVARLNDAHVSVRKEAVKALGRLGDAQAVEPLIARLNDANANVRLEAAEVLGRLGDARAVKPLIARLNDANANVRRGAAEALDSLGDAAVEPLIAWLNNTYASRHRVPKRVLDAVHRIEALKEFANRLHIYR